MALFSWPTLSNNFLINWNNNNNNNDDDDDDDDDLIVIMGEGIEVLNFYHL